jgi:hypothetical protein
MIIYSLAKLVVFMNPRIDSRIKTPDVEIPMLQIES